MSSAEPDESYYDSAPESEDSGDEYEYSGSEYEDGDDGDDGDDGGAPAPPAEGDGELDIESEDFNRLINAFSEDPGARRAPRKPSSWTQSMEAEMESFHHELRDVNGYARKSRPTRIREQALSPEVKALLAQANIAYVEADLPGAIRQLEEVIRIEPTVRSAWYTLGMCFEEMGEEEKSIQCRIVGAHLTSNASDEWKTLARRSRERGLLQQSIYCLQQAIKKNRYDIDAIWDRAVMLKDSGRPRAAVDAFQAILRIQPYDAEVLRELIPLLVTLGDYEVGVGILENMRQESMRGAHVSAPQDPNIDPALAHTGAAVYFSLNELVTLTDLLILLRRPLQAILVIKHTIRWMRGEPRDDMPEDAQNDFELDDGDDAPELDREVRLRLGKARFMLRDTEEGKRHFSILAFETDPADQPTLFLDMADCYFEHRQYADALEWYRVLVEEGLVDDVQVWVNMGSCCQMTGAMQDAAQVYETIIAEHPGNLDVKLLLAEVYEELGARDRALQLVNDVVALRNQQALRAPEGEHDEGLPNASLSFFDEAAATPESRPSRPSLSFAEKERLERQREEETRVAWVQLCALEPRVFVDGFWRHDFVFCGTDAEDEATQARFDAARQWLQVAGRLVGSFRAMSLLFPKERFAKYRGVVRPRRGRRARVDLDSHAEELLSRLHDHFVDDASGELAPEQTSFRTVHFDDWVSLFMKYGLALAKLGEHDVANDMFRHVMVSNTVWPSEERRQALHLCWLACAMYARDHVRVFDVARWFAATLQFSNEPLRLITSLANGAGFYGVDGFVSATNAKLYQRRMRTHEAIVAGRPARINQRTGRWTLVGQGIGDDDDDDDESRASFPVQPLPTKSTPIGEMFYGYMMLCASSFQPAMGYLLRAYELQPNDPLLCLVSAVASLCRATNRQVDNRNHTIVQGLALLSQYAALRGPVSEVEYNFGRAFHQLGLVHLAVPRYRRVLELATADPGPGFDMSREAAYNLALIYTASESPELAAQLYDEWLVV